MRETAPSGSAAITLFLLGPELYLGILAETQPFPADATLALNRGEKPVQQLVRTVVDVRGGVRRRGFVLFRRSGRSAQPVSQMRIGDRGKQTLLVPSGPALPFAEAARRLGNDLCLRTLGFLVREAAPRLGLFERGQDTSAIHALLLEMATAYLPVSYHADLSHGKHYVESRLVAPDTRPVTILSIGQDGARVTLTKPVEISRVSNSDFRQGLFLNGQDEQPFRDEIVVMLQGDQALKIAAPNVRGTSMKAFLGRVAEFDMAARLRLREALGTIIGKDDPFGLVFAWMQRLQAFGAVTSANARAPFGGGIDLAVPCGDAGIYLRGWLWDPHEALQRFDVVSAYGEKTSALDRLVRIDDEKVGKHFQKNGLPMLREKPGFVAFLPMAKGARHGLQTRAELDFAGGVKIDLMSPVSQMTPRLARDLVLRSVPRESVTPEILETLYHPALGALQAECLTGKRIDRVVSFGTQPTKPGVSIVIPLYGRYDFIRAQWMRFAFDPDLTNAELIYVLDKPEDAAEVDSLLRGLHLTFGVPCRLAVNAENYGFAGASNLGASLATAPMLLFLNSDVVPMGHGWLSQMLGFYKATPEIGLLGPKLLFPDGSIQHAGLHFIGGITQWWLNGVYCKGYPADWPAACTSREVPAVTGACMMIARGKYEAVGGIPEHYVIGDFEDTDLSLRCRRQGWRNWYMADAALMHMERASIEGHASYSLAPVDAYNGWLHTKLWGADIAALQGAFAGGPLRQVA
ncbi:glycosyltransferase family 2 protein [Oceanibaculum indicum]|uniref:Putative glycosyl transferase, family 2 n=1 Tax=Oceanibaculum indicum P24 TaxID=1207063 RepID=K2IQ55_9PROT|nr:glycosyltransferase [Oceanibaculum indicum]EKE72281.1 Putative glycosyl transferase, family 2 [Oceanibaculum indicum P24]